VPIGRTPVPFSRKSFAPAGDPHPGSQRFLLAKEVDMAFAIAVCARAHE
jgi:hypothetical protein